MKTTKSTKTELSGHAAMWIATWFGCGYAPVAPGTWGSAGALLPAVLLAQAGWKPLHFFILAVAALPIAIWAAGSAAKQVGRKDPGLVVVDEVIGQWVTLAGATMLHWPAWIAAFFLFRVMDIWKPFPVRRLESLPGGYGIVADDFLAGVYGAAVLFLISRLLP